MTAPTIAVKRCTKCGETKSVDGFHRNRLNRDGLASQCKECRRAYQRAYDESHREEIRAYREVHREERRAKQCAYYEAHREERLAYNDAYRDAHREEIRAKQRAYCDVHREERRAKQCAYYEAHREERCTYSRDSNALLGNPTEERWREITAKHATRRGRWSEAEDAYLTASTDRVVDDALALKRTYSSVKKRIVCLRKRGVALARDAN